MHPSMADHLLIIYALWYGRTRINPFSLQEMGRQTMSQSGRATSGPPSPEPPLKKNNLSPGSQRNLLVHKSYMFVHVFK
jgi:hypothetical protein